MTERVGKDFEMVPSSPELVVRMQSMLRQMPPALKKVAAYVIPHFREMDGLQLQQLARLTQTSTATITRFVRFLGFAGFQDFRLEVVRECSSLGPVDGGYRAFGAIDNEEELCRRVFRTNMQILQDTMQITDPEMLARAFGMIEKSRKVLIFAQGRSRIVAESFRQRLRRIGITCEVFCDPHAAAVECAALRGDETAIGISAHGRSRQVISALKAARQCRVPTIAVTSVSGAPIEEWADVILRTTNNEQMQVGLEPSGTAIAQMVLLDCVYVMLYRKRKKTCDLLEQRTRALLREELMH